MIEIEEQCIMRVRRGGVFLCGKKKKEKKNVSGIVVRGIDVRAYIYKSN